MTHTDWYENRSKLKPGMVFETAEGLVMLDRKVPGDGTKWYVADYVRGKWFFEDGTVEPSELEKLLDNPPTT